MLLAGRRIHRELRQDLKHVVLQHVADRSGLVVEPAAILHAEILGHGDLDAVDVIAVPQRLEHGVGEPRVDDVLHRLLAEVVVDPEDVLFGEESREQAAQCASGVTVVAEWLLDDQARVVGTTGFRQRLRHCREQAGWHCQVMQRPLRLAELLAKLGEGRRVVVVAVDIAQQAHQPRTAGASPPP